MITADVHAVILTLLKQGDECLMVGNTEGALEHFTAAVAQLPPPTWSTHPIALPAWTALGEIRREMGDLTEALTAFQTALLAPGGAENPLLLLRLGQTYHESQDLPNAAAALAKAYALGGNEIFEGEDGDYLTFLAEHQPPPPQTPPA